MVIPKLTLYYFGFGGRAEPLRLAAAIGRVAFTNKSVDFKDFGEMKQTLPLAQLPILEIEEEGKEKVTLTQSISILRYFGKLGGLYPEDPVEAMKVDSMVDILSDASKPIEVTVMGPVKSYLSDNTEFSDEEKLAIRKRFAENGIPKYISVIEEAIERNGSGWLVGNGITIADLGLYRFVTWIKSGMLDGLPTSALDSYPGVLANAAKVEEMPEVMEWNNKYPKPYGDFEFVPN